MIWKFLDVAAVKLLHHDQIEDFGGSHGLRDAGLLESAVLRAEMKVHYEPSATVVQVAASLGWGLIKNHAFIDGNKRIGLVSMVTFLKSMAIASLSRRTNRWTPCAAPPPAR